MPIRVVARIRPVLETDADSEIVLYPVGVDEKGIAKSINVPSPRDESDELNFALDSVYGSQVSQEAFFNSEAHADAKYLFQGKDVTYIAYGSSGTGKTHTIRGGLKLEDRGLTPRLMSNIFRRAKKVAKDSGDQIFVKITLSYIEIYQDEIYDLFSPPESRSSRGLLLDDKDNRTHIIGLSEKECVSLKDFSKIYIEANKNRATAGTKLNSHSSRSHAILRVKITQSIAGKERISVASAVDLAGSEDSRKAELSNEALDETASVNKSLFAVTQCIDAITRGEKRVPFRESKLTRVMGLGQKPKTHITMILNLAPVKSYHLDSISSLNVSSRTKRIEAREIENEIVFKQVPRINSGLHDPSRQALRPLADAPQPKSLALGKPGVASSTEGSAPPAPPTKMFMVFKDSKPAPKPRRTRTSLANVTNTTPMVHRVGRSPGKRIFDTKSPTKHRRPLQARPTAIVRHDDEDDAPYEDEMQEGMRYMAQAKQHCPMVPDKRAGNVRARTVLSKTRGGLGANAPGPMNGSVANNLRDKHRNKGGEDLASRLPVAKSSVAHTKRASGQANRRVERLAAPSAALGVTGIQKPLQATGILRA
ncbi:hypothetical protein BROUX41_000445 [Berkeleyomyces rouxiae]|uniref:uncharacterized protein n=1 Tax=Berkeleyomyces rouxiae TaxID=2035830 RepID=UPI003B8216E6